MQNFFFVVTTRAQKFLVYSVVFKHFENFHFFHITTTYLYNFDSLKAEFLNGKTLVYEDIYYFSYFCSKTLIVGTR